MNRSKYLLVFAAVILLSCLVFTGPLSARQEGKVRVVATLFPDYDFARQVGKDKAEVSLLLPPGVEAHAFEPKPHDILKINEADIFIYTGNFMEPWVGDILKGVSNKNLLVIDAGKGVFLMKGKAAADPKAGRYDHRRGVDPHIWLDLDNARIMTDNILEGLIKKDPSNKDFYIKNAEEYKQTLRELDERFKTAFANCVHREFIYSGHLAFGYFAKRYNLTCLSPYRSYSPDSEPTPQDMIELVKKLRQKGLKYVYYEELLSPKMAAVIAQETGAQMLPLNGAHNVSKKDLETGITFLDIMERNLENLKRGLQCQ